METQEIAAKALEILGPNGEHWTKGGVRARERWISPGVTQATLHMDNYCLVAALALAARNGRMLPVKEFTTLNCWKSLPEETQQAVIAAIGERLGRPWGSSADHFNDKRDTVFDDIRAVLEKLRAG